MSTTPWKYAARPTLVILILVSLLLVVAISQASASPVPAFGPYAPASATVAPITDYEAQWWNATTANDTATNISQMGNATTWVTGLLAPIQDQMGNAAYIILVLAVILGAMATAPPMAIVYALLIMAPLIYGYENSSLSSMISVSFVITIVLGLFELYQYLRSKGRA